MPWRTYLLTCTVGSGNISIFSPPPATRVAVLSLCKVLGQAKHANSRIQPLNFVDQKSRKFGEKSPKIQEGPQHDQFWNLNSPTDPASRRSKIGPLDILGRRNLLVKFLSLSLNFCERGGSRTPPIFILLQSYLRAL